MLSFFKVVPILIVLCSNRPGDCSKLNLPRVLLPIFDTVSVKFTLEVTGGGCYRWSATRFDIIRLTVLDADPVYGCSNRAVITSITNEHVRSTAIILAEDIKSDNIIRTDVIVDVISSLSIVTTTRELYLEEAPEMFEVRAYDAQGNEFTTLDGVEFHWHILEEFMKFGHVLRFMSFQDAPYETSDSVHSFDSLGKQGNIVLIEGIRTGVAKVSVELPYHEYAHVRPDEVQLMVVANLIIEPADAHIILTDTIQYRLLQVKQGRLVELPLTSAEYYLRSDDTSVAVVNKNEVTGLRVGKVKLVLHDVNVLDENVKPPCTFLTVSLPSKMALAILPGNSWALASFQEATLVAQVFGRNNNRFHLGRNTKISIQIPDSLFFVTMKSTNGSIVCGFGNKPGVAKVVASLNLAKMLASSMVDVLHTEEILEATATLTIFPKLSLSPEVVVFPWNYYPIKRNKIIMIPNGGDGKYLWASSNNTVAFVSQNGIVLVNSLGATTITLSMKSNPDIQVKSIVHVLQPVELDFLYHSWEGEIGEPIFLNIAMFGIASLNGEKSVMPFTQCDFLNFNVEVEEGFIYDETQKGIPKGLACSAIAIIGLIHESSTVNISLLTDDELLDAGTAVSSYKNMATVYPSPPRPIVLAVGSSLNIMFTCGPFSGFAKKYYHVVTKPDILAYDEVFEIPDNQTFNVKCLRYGEAEFSFYLYSIDNEWPVHSVYSSDMISFICAAPTELSLSSEMGPNCPRFGSQQVWAPIFGKLCVNLVAKNINGIPFDNATSLPFKWKVSDNNAISFDGQDSLNLNMMCATKTWNHYKIFYIKNANGTVTIQVRIKGEHEVPTALLTVKIVEPVIIEPNSISIFNHPKSRPKLKIMHGSSYFNIQSSPKGIVDFEYEDYSRILTLMPQRDGLGELTVMDLCISYPPTIANIKVLKVGRININIVSKIEKGQKVLATVQIFDSEDKPVLLPDGMEHDDELSLLVGTRGIIEIISARSSETERKNGIINYSVAGAGLGDTTIQVKWQDTASNAVQIQVFSPIRIYPRIMTLMIGAELQVTVLGGPSSNPGFQFKIGDPHIASVSSGFVRGLHLGHTTLTVIAKSHHSEALSKDTIDVYVSQLNGIQINVPITQLCVGCTMPAWAAGIPSSLTPLVLGSVNPPLQFKWSVSPTGIIELQDIFVDVGIEISDEDRLSMRIFGLRPGKVTVHVSVNSRYSERTVLFNSSLKVEIISKLLWVHPGRTGEILLVAPNSQTQLTTNKEVDYISAYQLSSSAFISQNGFAVTNARRKQALGSQNVVTVTSYGLLTTGPILGDAMVLARMLNNGVQQTVGLIVEVKPVSYLMINVATRLETGGHKLHGLPRGLHLLLNITYHDNMGNIFYATPLTVQLEASRYDRVTISHGKTNSSVTLNLESTGRVVFQLYNRNFQQLGDYMKLSIVNEIYPNREFMSVGEAVCFKVPIGGSEGVWSSDSDVIHFDRSGIANALKLGASNIIYSYLKPTSCIIMSTVINVLPVNNVQFEILEHLIVTNSYAGISFNIPFSVRNEKNRQEALTSFINACPYLTYLPKAYPFSCEIGFNNPDTRHIYQLFNVSPVFDLNTGLYACKLTGLTDPSNITSTVYSNITMKVNFQQNYSDSLILTFYPAIYVHASSLLFSNVNAPAMLVIVGVPEVLNAINIEISDPKVLKISAPYFAKEFYQNYPVYLDQSYWLHPDQHTDLSLTINSVLTKQKIKIAVLTLFMECDNSNVPCVVLKSDYWWSSLAKFLSEYKYISLLTTFTIGVIFALKFCFRRMVRNVGGRRREQYYFMGGNSNCNANPNPVQQNPRTPRGRSPRILRHRT